MLKRRFCLVELGLSRGHRHGHRSSGYWRTVYDEVTIPGYWREERLPPRYGWVVDGCGHRSWVMIDAGGCRRVWVPAQTGEVEVRKEVRTEHRQFDVPVEREEVVIERRPASGKAASTPIAGDETIRVPVSQEQVKVEKQPVVKEEVKVGKRKTQGKQRVEGTVRKEDIKVEKHGDPDVQEQ